MNKYFFTVLIGVTHFLYSSAGYNKFRIGLKNVGLVLSGDTIIIDGLGICNTSQKSNVKEKIDPKAEMILNLIVQKTGGSGTNGVTLYPCTEIDNTQLVLYNGKYFLLFNPQYLNQFRLNAEVRSNRKLIADDSTWVATTVLVHEYSHLTLGHLSNPRPNATQREMELEADESTGFVIYLLGGTLKQAQFAFANISDSPTYTYPGKQDRLDAVKKGYLNAKKMYKLRK